MAIRSNIRLSCVPLAMVLAVPVALAEAERKGAPPNGGPVFKSDEPAIPPGKPGKVPGGKPELGHADKAPGKSAGADRAEARRKPSAPDSPETRAKLLSDLYAHLATAEGASDAGPVVEAIERLWAFSGSPTVDVLLERAAIAAAAGKKDLALKLLDAVVDLAPDFAEGWNRRAYVYYTLNDFERALGDLRRAIALEPNHFKALEGIATIFKETGRKKAALKAFQELLQINPNAAGAKEAAEELARDVDGQGI